MKTPSFSIPTLRRVFGQTLIVSTLLSLSGPVNALDITVVPGGNIQSAMDQVNAAGGGTVLLTPGIHTISAALVVRSNVILRGAGAGSTTIQNTGAAADYTLITKTAAAFSNVTIRDLALDGRNSIGGNGIYFDGAGNKNLSLINLEVRNMRNQGVHPKGIDGLVQLNNYVHDSGAVSLCHNQYVRRATNVNVSGCRFDRSPAGDGAKFTLWNGASVTNCTFTGNTNRGLRTQDVNANGSFTYNTVIQNALDGMEIVGANTDVSYNAAYNNGTNIANTNRHGIRVLAGNGTVNHNNSFGNQGNYDIHGSFTQSGNTSNPASFPIIQAEDYSATSGTALENCSDIGGGKDVGYINKNDYLVFSGINLTGATRLDARVASNNSGGTIEVRLDRANGPLVGTVVVPGTGGWQKWTTQFGAINGASGIHTVYLVFNDSNRITNLLNLNWIQFK